MDKRARLVPLTLAALLSLAVLAGAATPFSRALTGFGAVLAGVAPVPALTTERLFVAARTLDATGVLMNCTLDGSTCASVALAEMGPGSCQALDLVVDGAGVPFVVATDGTQASRLALHACSTASGECASAQISLTSHLETGHTPDAWIDSATGSLIVVSSNAGANRLWLTMCLLADWSVAPSGTSTSATRVLEVECAEADVSTLAGMPDRVNIAPSAAQDPNSGLLYMAVTNGASVNRLALVVCSRPTFVSTEIHLETACAWMDLSTAAGLAGDTGYEPSLALDGAAGARRLFVVTVTGVSSRLAVFSCELDSIGGLSPTGAALGVGGCTAVLIEPALPGAVWSASSLSSPAALVSPAGESIVIVATSDVPALHLTLVRCAVNASLAGAVDGCALVPLAAQNAASGLVPAGIWSPLTGELLVVSQDESDAANIRVAGMAIGCGASTFASADGVCMDCPPGAVAAYGPLGARCACAAGTFELDSPVEPCVSCPPGTAKPARGPQVCDLCVVGTVQPDAGAALCVACANVSDCPMTGLAAPLTRGATGDDSRALFAPSARTRIPSLPVDRARNYTSRIVVTAIVCVVLALVLVLVFAVVSLVAKSSFVAQLVARLDFLVVRLKAATVTIDEVPIELLQRRRSVWGVAVTLLAVAVLTFLLAALALEVHEHNTITMTSLEPLSMGDSDPARLAWQLRVSATFTQVDARGCAHANGTCGAAVRTAAPRGARFSWQCEQPANTTASCTVIAECAGARCALGAASVLSVGYAARGLHTIDVRVLACTEGTSWTDASWASVLVGPEVAGELLLPGSEPSGVSFRLLEAVSESRDDNQYASGVGLDVPEHTAHGAAGLASVTANSLARPDPVTIDIRIHSASQRAVRRLVARSAAIQWVAAVGGLFALVAWGAVLLVRVGEHSYRVVRDSQATRAAKRREADRAQLAGHLSDDEHGGAPVVSSGKRRRAGKGASAGSGATLQAGGQARGLAGEPNAPGAAPCAPASAPPAGAALAPPTGARADRTAGAVGQPTPAGTSKPANRLAVGLDCALGLDAAHTPPKGVLAAATAAVVRSPKPVSLSGVQIEDDSFEAGAGVWAIEHDPLVSADEMSEGSVSLGPVPAPAPAPAPVPSGPAPAGAKLTSLHAVTAQLKAATPSADAVRKAASESSELSG